MKKQFLILSLIICLSIIDRFYHNNLIAQQNNEIYKLQIGLTARSYGDSIYLRWAVVKPEAWRLLKENGVIIERAEKGKDGKYGPFIRLTEKPIKPWTLDKWEEYFAFRTNKDENKLDDESIAFILGMGEEPDEDAVKRIQIDENNLEVIKEKRRSSEWNLLMLLIAVNNSLKAAEGLGLFFVDRNVKENENYLYRIYCTYKSTIFQFDTTYYELTNKEFNPKEAIQKLDAIENDGSIEIIWKTNDNFFTFNIERSEDKINFKRLNESPYLTLKSSSYEFSDKISFIDTNVVNYKPYVYRIYARTVFADEIFIGEITAIGRDRTPPEQPFVPQPQHTNDKSVKIIWQMSEKPAPDLAGFYIGRDSVLDGTFSYLNKQPLPKTAREYVDTSFSLYNYNFYKVFAFDTAGNFSASYPVYVVLNDTVPPLPPKWKTASIDSNGVVYLELYPNTEFDLMGYRILRANDPDHEFSSIIESFDPDKPELKNKTAFMDTVDLNTTTKYVYYRATALDKRYNESKFSEILKVKRPDKIPPLPPLLYNPSITSNYIKIYFQPSESEDVSKHIVLRKLASSAKWDTIAILGPRDSVYVDESAEQNVLYAYAVFAKDSSNLSSDLSFVFEARRYFSGALPEIKNFIVEYDSSSSIAKIKWEYENLNDVIFVIYRSYGNSSFRRYKTIKDSNAREIIDDDFVFGEGYYSYAIKAFDRFNSESKMSPVRKILCKKE